MTNWFIVLPLLAIAGIAGFYQLFAISNTIDYSSNQQIPTGIPNNPNSAYVGTGIIAALQPQNTEYSYASFNITMVTGLIALIIGTVVIGVVAGIRLFSSGLSEFSVKIIYNSAIYYGLWGIFSALAYPVISAIPLFLGTLGWFSLTFIYTLGFFEGMR